MESQSVFETLLFALKMTENNRNPNLDQVHYFSSLPPLPDIIADF
jgi:hypothetical protein